MRVSEGGAPCWPWETRVQGRGRGEATNSICANININMITNIHILNLVKYSNIENIHFHFR